MWLSPAAARREFSRRRRTPSMKPARMGVIWGDKSVNGLREEVTRRACMAFFLGSVRDRLSPFHTEGGYRFSACHDATCPRIVNKKAAIVSWRLFCFFAASSLCLLGSYDIGNVISALLVFFEKPIALEIDEDSVLLYVSLLEDLGDDLLLCERAILFYDALDDILDDA